ncbi:hypothetical protein, partial [Enterococcus avium]|uniref:hypothetical protein n=1 Tax=Enterococcus avium TaxID=33945 RepID=UPI0032E45FF5
KATTELDAGWPAAAKVVDNNVAEESCRAHGSDEQAAAGGHGRGDDGAEARTMDPRGRQPPHELHCLPWRRHTVLTPSDKE